MVGRAGEPFPRQGPLIIANTRAPLGNNRIRNEKFKILETSYNLRFSLLLLLEAELVHGPPALLVRFAGATGTVIPGDVPPTRAFYSL